jgi:hypothetical protein
MSLGRCPEWGCAVRWRDGLDRACWWHVDDVALRTLRAGAATAPARMGRSAPRL